jgi:hypothetical protein
MEIAKHMNEVIPTTGKSPKTIPNAIDMDSFSGVAPCFK